MTDHWTRSGLQALKEVGDRLGFDIQFDKSIPKGLIVMKSGDNAIHIEVTYRPEAKIDRIVGTITTPPADLRQTNNREERE